MNNSSCPKDKYISRREATFILGFKNTRSISELIKQGYLKTYTFGEGTRELLSKKEVLNLPQKDPPVWSCKCASKYSDQYFQNYLILLSQLKFFAKLLITSSLFSRNKSVFNWKDICFHDRVFFSIFFTECVLKEDFTNQFTITVKTQYAYSECTRNYRTSHF